MEITNERTTETAITLSSEQYNDFIRCLSTLQEICNDVVIQRGVIRQRSNDNTSIFELDLNSIITDINISITNVKQKLNLLKTFQGQEVSIEINNEGFTFSDDFSSLEFLHPSADFMDNKYIEQAELEGIFSVEEENLLFDFELSTIITDRIRIVTQTFNSPAIQVKFDKDMASINAASQSKDQFAKFINNVEMNMELEKCSSNLSTLPFGIDHDTDVRFKMYKVLNQDVALNKFSTVLGDININMYSRSSIIEDEEE